MSNKTTIHVFDDYHEGMGPSEFAALVQCAIDDCAANGGGHVLLDRPGTYLCDGLNLRSHVDLHVGTGVTLKGSGNEDSYTHRPGSFELLRNETPICAFIYALGCEGASVSGDGAIDGNYEVFILPDQGDEPHLRFYAYPRPMTLYFEGCRNTTITDVTVQNAPFWTIHLVGCTNTVARNVKIHNEMRMPNTDGFDIDRCDNTLIEHCEIITGDDGICPKCTEETAQYGNCTNLTARDCVIESQSSAVKFGSSSFGDFENCVFERLMIRDTNRGLAFQLRDPGSARNIAFRDITITTKGFSKEWWGSGEAIYLTLLPRDNDTDLTGRTIENVRFERIRGTVGAGVVACAEEPGTMRRITLHDVDLQVTRQFDGVQEFDVRPWKRGDEKIAISCESVMVYGVSDVAIVLDDVTITDSMDSTDNTGNNQ